MRRIGGWASWCGGAQGGFDLNAHRLVIRLGDGEAFSVRLASRVAGRQVVHLAAGLQDEGVKGMPTDRQGEGLQDLFEMIPDGVKQAAQGRQRLLQGTVGLGALHDGQAGPEAGVAAQVADGGKQVVVQGCGGGDEGVRPSVTGGMPETPAARTGPVACRQGRRGVPEQVAGGGGEGREGRGMPARGGAKRTGQTLAREGVHAASPHKGGQDLRPVRAAGKFNLALEPVCGYLKADAETAPAGRAGIGRR